MTYEEAITVLTMVEAHGLADEAKKIAIEALEKQTPKEVIHITFGDDAPKALRGKIIARLCANCGEELAPDNYMLSYCANCGQALDWSDADV